MDADVEFQEKVQAYREELKLLQNEQKAAYERRETEINKVLSLEKNLKLSLHENDDLKRKHAEQLKAQSKTETLYKNQLKTKNKQKIELETQLNQTNKTLDTMRVSHAKNEAESKTKNENLEREFQKAKETISKLNSDRDEFHAKVKHDFEQKINQLKKDHERNTTHLVTQNAKSTETASILLEHERSENKNKQAILLSLKKEINELKEYNKRFDEQNELHARKTSELERLLADEKLKVIDKENMILCLKRDLDEMNEKIDRLTNLNHSLVLNLDMEKSYKITNEKILEEMRLEMHELECRLKLEQTTDKQYIQNLEHQNQSLQIHLKEMECANTQLIKQLECTHINLADVKSMLNAELQFRNENEKDLNQLRSINLDLKQRVNQLESELTSVKFKADGEKTKFEGDIEKLQKSQIQLKLKYEKMPLLVENKALKEKLQQIEKERNEEKFLLNQHLDEINRLKIENNNVNNFKENLKHLVLNSTNDYCKNGDQETNEKLPFKAESLMRSFSIDSHGSQLSSQSKSQSSENLSDVNVKNEEFVDQTKTTEIKRINFSNNNKTYDIRDNRRYEDNQGDGDNDDDYYRSDDDDDDNNRSNRRNRRHVNNNVSTASNFQHRISNYKGRHFIPDFNCNNRRGGRLGPRGGRIATSFRYSAYRR